VNPSRFDESVEDLRRTLPRRAVAAAILFGSTARGEATEESDVDLLLIPRRGHAMEEILPAIRDVEGARNVRISVIDTDTAFANLDRQLVDQVLRDGRPLVGTIPPVTVSRLELQPYRLVAFTLRGLSQKRKMALARLLFGYETRKRYKRKVYRRQVPGRIREWGGRRVSPGSVLVPEHRAGEMARVLREFGAKRILVPVWIQRP